MCRFPSNPYLFPKWNGKEYLFCWSWSDRFTLLGEANTNAHFHGNRACRGIFYAVLWVKWSRVWVPLSTGSKLMAYCKYAVPVPMLWQPSSSGGWVPSWVAPTKSCPRTSRGLCPTRACCRAPAAASACLFINEVIFSDFKTKACWTAGCPLCAASPLMGVRGKGRTQRQGSVSAFLAAIWHCKLDHRAQTHSAMDVVFQHNSFCEQRMSALGIWCCLYSVRALISFGFQSFSRCRKHEYMKPSL